MAWATPEGLMKWFLRTADFKSTEGKIRRTREAIQPGDTYTWRWHGFDDQHAEEGVITSLNGRDELQFRFAGNCLVDVKVSHLKEGTLVTVTQSEIPEEPDPEKNLYVNCLRGWTFYLLNLKSILEGGLDLRNKHNHLNMN
jgi:hypothetical protein